MPTATDFTIADLDLRDGGRYEDRSSYSWQLVGGIKYEADGWTAAIDGSCGTSRVAALPGAPTASVMHPHARASIC